MCIVVTKLVFFKLITQISLCFSIPWSADVKMPTYDQVRDRLIQAQPHIQPNILLDLAQDFKIEARTAEIIETLEEFLEELENRQDLLPDQPLEQSVKSFRTLYAKFDLDTRDLPNEPVEPPEAQPEEEPGSRRPSEKFLNSFTAAFKNMPLVELMQVLRHLGKYFMIQD